MKKWTVQIALLLLGAVSFSSNGFAQSDSLGDAARKVREKSRESAKVSPDEARDLFNSVDEIMTFVAKDTGLPRVVNTKRKMLTRTELLKKVDDVFNDSVETDRIEQSAVVLKKFGFLPPQFDLKKMMSEDQSNNIGAFYDPKDKTMYLLNWISEDEQKPIIAHELTHAVQDQEFNLQKWMKAGRNEPSKPTMAAPANLTDESSISRRAVVEGQGMMVYVDYLLKPRNINLADSLGAADAIRQEIQGYEPPLVLRDAPVMLRDTMVFPYITGFEFELELLRKGGRATAYNGAFATPPATTHEVFQPEAYFERKRENKVGIPDLSKVLDDKYVAYDSGHIGELDVQSFVKQYGRDNDIYSVARMWDGGSYVAVKRKDLGDATPATKDLALIYVSKWANSRAARRIAELFAASLRKRLTIQQAEPPVDKDCGYGKACEGVIWSQKLHTSEGLVVIEVNDNDSVLISESFEEDTLNKLRPLVLSQVKNLAPDKKKELSTRLFELPGFQAMSERAGAELREMLRRELSK